MKNNDGARRVVRWGLVAMGALAALLVARAFFGLDWIDESFFLSTAHRLYQGDALLAHEWHPTQLFSAMTLPLFWLYCRVMGSTDGIQIGFRILYVLASGLAALWLFRALAARKGAMALLAALLMMLFAKSRNATFSFNTLVMLGFVLSGLCLYLYACGPRLRRHAYLCGLFYAASTLANPYLAGLFVLIAAGAAVTFAARRQWRRAMMPFWGWFLLGLASAALPFLAYLLCTAPLAAIPGSLRYIFADPSHARPPHYALYLVVRDVIRVHAPTLVPMALLGGYLLVKRLRGRAFGGAERALLLVAAIAVTAVNCALIVNGDSNRLRLLPMALAILGAFVYLLTERPDEPLFLSLYLPGIALGAVCGMSSNTGIYAVAAGLIPAALACILMLPDLAREMRADARPILGAAVLMCLIVAALGADRLYFVKSERGVETDNGKLNLLTAPARTGPCAGLMTFPDSAALYDRMIADLRRYATGDGNLLVALQGSFLYLASDMRCGAPSTWALGPDDPRYAAYYEMYPERLPDVIIVPNPAAMPYLDDDEPDPAQADGFIKDYLAQVRFELVQTGEMDIYIREGYRQ